MEGLVGGMNVVASLAGASLPPADVEFVEVAISIAEAGEASRLLLASEPLVVALPTYPCEVNVGKIERTLPLADIDDVPEQMHMVASVGEVTGNATNPVDCGMAVLALADLLPDIDVARRAEIFNLARRSTLGRDLAVHVVATGAGVPFDRGMAYPELDKRIRQRTVTRRRQTPVLVLARGSRGAAHGLSPPDHNRCNQNQGKGRFRPGAVGMFKGNSHGLRRDQPPACRSCARRTSSRNAR